MNWLGKVKKSTKVRTQMCKLKFDKEIEVLPTTFILPLFLVEFLFIIPSSFSVWGTFFIQQSKKDQTKTVTGDVRYTGMLCSYLTQWWHIQSLRPSNWSINYRPVHTPTFLLRFVVSISRIFHTQVVCHIFFFTSLKRIGLPSRFDCRVAWRHLPSPALQLWRDVRL